jgi:formylglycine-generating enzyme
MTPKPPYRMSLLLILVCGVIASGCADVSGTRAQDRSAADSPLNSVGIELIRVEPGEYLMGGIEPAEELVRAFPEMKAKPENFADEYPRHRVRITRPFLLGKFEVTVGQFRRFIDATGYRTEAETDGTGGWGYNAITGRSEGRRPHFSWRNPGYRQTEQYPVVNVTYGDVQAFLRWLSDKEHRHYRLPTEAEWEYANRAGGQTRYAKSGDARQLPTFARAVDLERQPEFDHVQDLVIAADDPTAFPVPVGSYAPNAWGFHDMHGNVWEWVADWYGETYYAESPVDDPSGPKSGEVRVRRGGGWNSFPIYLRSSFRNINTPVSRCLNLGFRVARDL